MKWKDILKNAITQGRVKEIEDIDIDIEDDDCLRWLNKLYDIIARHPESELHLDQVQDEESACAIKKAFTKGKNPNPFRRGSDEGKSNGYVNYIDGATVVFSVSTWGSMGERGIILYSLYHGGENTTSISKKGGAKVINIITSREKASKITKEICTYLNISYDKMARGVL